MNLADLPPEPDGPDPQVLYVAGWGRSGSTLLSRMIGEHPRFAFVGELRDLWLRGVSENRLCGCAEHFLDCPFWSAVGERAFGGWDAVPAEELLRLRQTTDKPWRVPLYRRGTLRGRLADDVALYTALLTRVTRALAAEVGPDTWLIDSSKFPSFAWLLGGVPDIDLRLCHLVRDPRGTVHSWQKRATAGRGRDDDTPTMARYSPVSASARWLVYNRQSEGLTTLGVPYVQTRYEDLVAAPTDELDRIVTALGLPSWDDDQLRGTEVHLGSSHSVVGNPMRMETGWTPLTPDDAWETALPDTTKRLVDLVTARTRQRYGYPHP